MGVTADPDLRQDADGRYLRLGVRHRLKRTADLDGEVDGKLGTSDRLGAVIRGRDLGLLHEDVSWVSNIQQAGQDVGSGAGSLATTLNDYHSVPIVWFQQSSTLNDRVTYHAELDNTECNAVADPTYDGHGPGLIEDDTGNGAFDSWNAAVPSQNAYWEPGLDPMTGTISNCDGGEVNVGWTPGILDLDAACTRDPDGATGAWYGTYSHTGGLAQGLHDKWNFTCDYNYPNGATGFWAKGGFSLTENPCPRVRTGKGYEQLSDATKERLADYYTILDKAGACYKFIVGYRSQQEQDKLYQDWHAIADKQGPDDHRSAATIDAQLRAAGFAQMYSGRYPNGVAKGGPAKVSRHTSMQAADISVGFRPVGLFAGAAMKPVQTAFNPAVHLSAEEAGLCGPPVSDPVHVETMYKKGDETRPSCHFG